MKQLFLLICLLVSTTHADPLNVVTTMPDLAEFAKRVGGDHVEVYSLAVGEENPHHVMMRPSMVTKMAAADLFIEMGLGFEHAYAPALLKESRNRKIEPGAAGYLDTSKGVRVREVPKNLDRTEGDVHPSGNPHYNLDPEYGRMMVKAIAAKLSELDPANKGTYEANAKAYDSKLASKIKQWKAALAGKKTKFVSYHKNWVYFAERFGVQEVGTIEPKPGVEPGPRHLEDLIGRMKNDGVKLIVKESFFSDRLPNEIAQRTGARVATVPIMVGGTPEATDYIAMLDQIVSAFGGK